MIAIIISILMMRKLRHKEVKQLAPNHTARELQGWDLNPQSDFHFRTCTPDHYALLCLFKVRIHIRPLGSNIF